ncbi:MAG TPA: TetR/AcrR family transcriptional regulator [Gemmatimonadaceae bacterium]|jgi:AcrR family transcriptional regulator|nr:TetR/AcrR family transcriptional regulator [Gemmatimonadaceae bacterium]
MSARTTRRKARTNDPEALRGRVLDAAADAFQSRGFNATSMHDIVRAAGATGGATYHHFPSKKALALAVIRERVALAIEETWILPMRSARSTLDGVLTVFAEVIASLERRRVVSGCEISNLALELALADPDFRVALNDVFDRWRNAIADRVRAEQATGALDDTDADELATLVVASYSGAMAIAKASQDSAPLKACALQLARVMSRRRPTVRPR